MRFQINKVTSWIDGSFVYSSSEAWANTMRSFKNGSFLMEPTRQFPVRNTMRAPLFNNAVPNVMRMLNPERLYRELSFLFFILSFLIYLPFTTIIFAEWRCQQTSLEVDFTILLYRACSSLSVSKSLHTPDRRAITLQGTRLSMSLFPYIYIFFSRWVPSCNVLKIITLYRDDKLHERNNLCTSFLLIQARQRNILKFFQKFENIRYSKKVTRFWLHSW